MDIQHWLTVISTWAIDGWNSLGPHGPYYLWLASGGVGLAISLVVFSRLGRALLGHRKFRGRWFNPEQYRHLMQLLHEDQMNNRVLAHHELQALRDFKYGNSVKPLFDQKYGGYTN